ncbi:LysE family translocator [Halorientalis salina]|uniref:LysE family translocator n=1 Tax=Halorientalis salina TaxID=2932266 RepID=UPI0010AC4CF6|nr:LysE family transporter [Halorientalis salina]
MAAGTLLSTLAAGVVFGVALAAPPGPMNAIIAEESVVRGWLAGFRAGLGAMTADACFFLLALVGVVAVVQERPTLRAAMILAGGVLMLYFAYGAVSDAREQFGAGAADDTAATTGRGFRKAFVLALTNPYQIAFWLTVGVGLLEPGTVDVLAKTPYVGSALSGLLVVTTGSPALVVGLFGGIVAWIVGFPAALVAAGNRVDRLAPLIAVGSALVLGGFGVYFLADGLTALT